MIDGLPGWTLGKNRPFYSLSYSTVASLLMIEYILDKTMLCLPISLVMVSDHYMHSGNVLSVLGQFDE